MYSKEIQLCIYIYLFFFKFFSHLGYWRILKDFPGNPVVKILHFQCRGCSFQFLLGKLRSHMPHNFIAVLFMIARTWKQHRCPLTDKWIKKTWYIYTMEYHSAIKENEFKQVLVRWMNLELLIQSEVSQKEKSKYSIYIYTYTHTHIYIERENLGNWYWWTYLQGRSGDTM